MGRWIGVWIVGFAFLWAGVRAAGQTRLTPATFDNSLLLAPLYVEYLDDPAEKFAREAQELKTRIGGGAFIKLGFAGFLRIQFPDTPLNRPLTAESMAASLSEIDMMIARARQNGLVAHVSIISGFFHNSNELRYSAIRQDVRNAQWFSDGWIADPADFHTTNDVPVSVWVTPSRYARLLRARIEEGVRFVGARLAAQMRQFPDTLLTVSGDGEVELSSARWDAPGAPIADYSPFTIEEFRDYLRKSRYAGDLSPATDDDLDGHTFDRDFGQVFTTWKLRYFDSSGPIPFAAYAALPEKLPSSGPYSTPGGFDAPRDEKPKDVFWDTWMEFRQRSVGNWVRDFAGWMTSSKDPETGFAIPPERFYSHQIPADFLFGHTNDQRLRTSASPVETALITPDGSPGVTILNAWNGKTHSKTMTAGLLSFLSHAGGNWAVTEYGPSIPVGGATEPESDLKYYRDELNALYASRPHLIVPILWSDSPLHKTERIQGSVFERALHDFVERVGNVPWTPARQPAEKE